MYKLLIVDDEEIEREGLANFIPWEQYGIQLIGTAWNGQDALNQIYKQLMELFRLGQGLGPETLLRYSLFRETAASDRLMNLKKLGEAPDCGELLYEIWAALCKMNLTGFSRQEKLQTCAWGLKALYGQDAPDFPEAATDWDIALWFMSLLEDRRWPEAASEQNSRLRDIYFAIYAHLPDPEFNLRYLSREVIFMNEDYLGRLFARHTGMKLSDYLQKQRIRLAVELMEFRPGLRISQLVTLVGYAPDGQYFSKAFRKVMGISPKQYQETLQK